MHSHANNKNNVAPNQEASKSALSPSNKVLISKTKSPFSSNAPSPLSHLGHRIMSLTSITSPSPTHVSKIPSAGGKHVRFADELSPSRNLGFFKSTSPTDSENPNLNLDLSAEKLSSDFIMPFVPSPQHRRLSVIGELVHHTNNVNNEILKSTLSSKLSSLSSFSSSSSLDKKVENGLTQMPVNNSKQIAPKESRSFTFEPNNSLDKIEEKEIGYEDIIDTINNGKFSDLFSAKYKDLKAHTLLGLNERRALEFKKKEAEAKLVIESHQLPNALEKRALLKLS